jgi:TonB family protein
MSSIKRTISLFIQSLFVLSILLPSSLLAQDGDFFMVVADPPELHGSIDSLNKAAKYTKKAAMDSAEGQVVVQFIVNKDGSVSNAKILRGVHDDLNQSALQTIKQATFTPGRQRGEKVRVQQSLPVTFKMTDSDVPELPKKPADENKSSVYMSVEKMPQLKGGMAKILQRIEYPNKAKKEGVEGRVTVQFVVEKDGSVSNPEVLRGIGSGCDKEAIRVIKEAEFEPGPSAGRAGTRSI